jgi:hypothetical protein
VALSFVALWVGMAPSDTPAVLSSVPPPPPVAVSAAPLYEPASAPDFMTQPVLGAFIPAASLAQAPVVPEPAAPSRPAPPVPKRAATRSSAGAVLRSARNTLIGLVLGMLTAVAIGAWHVWAGDCVAADRAAQGLCCTM